MSSKKNKDESACQNLTRSITKRIIPVPPTPNIDQLKIIYNKFKSQDSNQTDTSIFDRVNSEELSEITKKVQNESFSLNSYVHDI